MLNNFHFLSPEFFYLLIPTWLFVFWLLRIQDSAYIWKKIVDERFLPHLLDANSEGFFKAPIHLGTLITLIILALASPAYKIKEQTQSNERSEVVFILKTTNSMLSKDLLPTRIKRAVFKINDFLSLRKDLRSALIAYSGSAHLVIPLTKDKSIINSFASTLDPKIMPIKGDALYQAVLLASKQFIEVDGTIIVLADDVNPKQLKLIKEDRALDNYNIVFFTISSEALRSDNFEKSIDISFDDRDIKALSSEVDYQFSNALSKKEGRFENSGYGVVAIIMLYMLFFFRSGFLGELWRLR